MNQSIKPLIFILILIGEISCISNYSPICIPEKSSLEEADLKGPVKRVTEHKYYNRYHDVIISEYDREGMLTSQKTIYDDVTITYTYKYDEQNRLVLEIYERLFLKTGETDKNVIKTSYNKNTKRVEEYAPNLVEKRVSTYQYGNQGQLLSESVEVREYDKVTQKIDTGYIDKRIFYRYEDNILKYKIEYINENDSTIIEYDKKGNRISTTQYNEYSNIVVWNGNVKAKEVLYRYGLLDRVLYYDAQGRLIEDQGYGSTDCNQENHLTFVDRTTYISDDDYTCETYREYATFNPRSKPMWSNCHLEKTSEHHCHRERDEYGNITKEYYDEVLRESYEYEYFE